MPLAQADSLLRGNAWPRRRSHKRPPRFDDDATDAAVEEAPIPSAAPCVRCRASAEGIGTFWHATDWHLNEFEPSSPSPCDMCRSTIVGTECAERAGPFGHPDCDPSTGGWQEAIAMMRREQPTPDFILAGGDWIGHIPESRLNPPALLSAAVLLNRLLSDHFAGVPVMHTVGNHDTWPYFSLAPVFMDWDRAFEKSQGNEWVRATFPGKARTHWQQHGYYARRLSRRLWGISLNTNELSKTDGGQQLDWLRTMLDRMRQDRQTAILLGHIPPGPSHFEFDSICAAGHYYQRAGGACWNPMAQSGLLALLAAYADVVPNSFFGHHHTSSLRVVYNSSAAARHVMYLSPSLTPRNPTHDPAVRLYYYNRSSGAVVDFVDYSHDLRQSNAAGRINWRVEAALRKAPLNLSSLSAVAWESAARRMLEYDHAPQSQRELDPHDPFLSWMSSERCKMEVYIASGDSRVPPLRRCKLAVLCPMLHLEDAPYAQCLGVR
ncbi:hypothetical protein AB1Y20_020503 [Prymnesium parvum]|uniref:Calcineurin-like phosphoesterase domain-containing protein n=1 Tax=Prymnesium parvum TaxID=97485 RepID=A0AB34JXK0_PRYPA